MHIRKLAAACAWSLLMAPSFAAPAKMWPISSVEPAAEDFSDLQPLAEAIGSARVVALGEQTHGSREEYLLKTRLLKFLHQKMGFDVLLLESGFYDMARLAERVERGEKLDDIAPGNVFFMYARTAEGRGMLQYVDRQRALGKPLALGGIDAQHTGELSKTELLPRLQQHLRQAVPALGAGAGWEQYAALAQPLLEMQRTPPPAAQQVAFRQHSDALKSSLCQADAAPVTFSGNAFWCKVVKSVEAQATSYWSADHDYLRDNQMGDNAIWLAERMYPGRKVVIWAHTVHVARGFQRTPYNLQAGEVMHRRWGAGYKVVQFSGAGGEILDFATMNPLPLPAIPGDSLEASLAREKHELLGLTAGTRISQPQFSYEYLVQPGAELGVNWDVLLFIRKITPVRLSR
ncbi:erythromycin esterase family protein [Pseudoduganella sp.]|uniref:erythromycin esterase family protein n=1 Tax=Pseudoduganella sp. TaxID=1880898 RepID=UPI0035AFFCD7